MSPKIREIATSSTATVFTVIAVTGVMLFFHLFESNIKELHEVLGVVFVVAALAHITVNWRPMRNYFAKKSFIAIATLTALVAAGFIAPTLSPTSKGENPKKVLIVSMLHAPIEHSFAILAGDSQSANAKLEAAQIKVEGSSIDAIAKANQTSPYKIVSILSAK